MPNPPREIASSESVQIDTPATISDKPAQGIIALKRRSIGLSKADVESLDLVSRVYGISVNDAVRKSIAISAHLLKERQSGGRILVQDEDKSIRELVFLP
jgi:hypothetical protein